MQLSEFIEYLQDLPPDLEVCFITPGGGEWWEVQGIVMYGTDPFAMIHLQPFTKPDPPLRRRPYWATLKPMYKKTHPEYYEVEKRNAETARIVWLREQENQP